MTTKKGSPWSGLGRKLTAAEYADLKKWKINNPLLRYRMGDSDGAGRYFLNYSPCCSGGELWGTHEKVIRIRKIARENAERKRTPELEAMRNAKRRKHYAESPAEREKQKKAFYRWAESIGPIELSARRKVIMKKANAKQSNIENKKRWAAMNKEKMTPIINEAFARRRAHVRYSALSSGADRNKIKAIYAESKKQENSSGEQRAVDHVVPLKRGGLHHEMNMQILPYGINSSKNDNPFWLSSEYLDFRDVPEFLWPEHLKPHYQLMLRIFGHPLKKYAEVI